MFNDILGEPEEKKEPKNKINLKEDPEPTEYNGPVVVPKEPKNKINLKEDEPEEIEYNGPVVAPEDDDPWDSIDDGKVDVECDDCNCNNCEDECEEEWEEEWGDDNCEGEEKWDKDFAAIEPKNEDIKNEEHDPWNSSVYFNNLDYVQIAIIS